MKLWQSEQKCQLYRCHSGACCQWPGAFSKQIRNKRYTRWWVLHNMLLCEGFSLRWTLITTVLIESVFSRVVNVSHSITAFSSILLFNLHEESFSCFQIIEPSPPLGQCIWGSRRETRKHEWFFNTISHKYIQGLNQTHFSMQNKHSLDVVFRTYSAVLEWNNEEFTLYESQIGKM